MAGIFISYRRESSPTARLIGNYLRSHFGPESVFIDTDSIDPGIDFRERLKERLGGCDVMLAIIDGDWLEGFKVEPAWVRREIETAMERKIPIIPVLIDDTKMPPEDALPKTMQSFFYYEAAKLNTDADFDQHMQRLMGAIGRHIERAKATSTDELRTRATIPPSLEQQVKTSHPPILRGETSDGLPLGQRTRQLIWVLAVVLIIAVSSIGLLWRNDNNSGGGVLPPPVAPTPVPPAPNEPPSGQPPSGGLGKTTAPPVSKTPGPTDPE